MKKSLLLMLIVVLSLVLIGGSLAWATDDDGNGEGTETGDPAPTPTLDKKDIVVTCGSKTIPVSGSSSGFTVQLDSSYEDSDTVTVSFEDMDDFSASASPSSFAVSTISGSRDVTLTVTNEDNVSKEFTLTISRETVTTPDPESDVSTLSSLSARTGTSASKTSSLSFDSKFDSGTKTYKLTVPDDHSVVTLAFDRSNDNAKVETSVSSGLKLTSSASSTTEATVEFPTSATSGTITIKVTAQNGTANTTYRVNLERDTASDDLTLKTLYVQDKVDKDNKSASQVKMDNNFSSSRTSYTFTVDNDTEYLYLYPTATSSSATVSVSGGARVNENSSGGYFEVRLNAGVNKITVTTKIGSGSSAKTKEYTLNVTRASQVTRAASLNALSVRQTSVGSSSAYTLSPTFAYNITDYTVYVPTNRTEAFIHLTPYNADATVTVSNSTLVSAGIYRVDMSSGTTRTATISVTQGGTTTNYKVVLNSGKDSELLSNLIVSSSEGSSGSYKLLPSFNANENEYLAIIPYDSSLSKVYVQATVKESGDTLKVNGSTVTSGKWSEISISAGKTVNTNVVVSGGDTNTYKLTLYAVPKNANNDATLSGLELRTSSSSSSAIELNQAFSGSTTSYTASVANNVESLNVYPTTRDNAALVLVNGRYVSGNNETVYLSEGSNTVTVLVYAEDGSTTQSYTVTVTRAASTSTAATLSALQVRTANDSIPLSLVPSLSDNTTSYTVNLPEEYSSVNFLATPASGGTVSIQGSAVTGGSWTSAYGLNVGNNSFTIVVTAADGSTSKTYTLTVVRGITVNASNQALTVNGTGVTSAAYNINGNNYFKLRDIAYALRSTNKNIEVGYNETTRVIALTSGRDYTLIGGEMVLPSSYTSVKLSNQTMTYNGANVTISAYNIDGNNYFMLRDIGELLDCAILYDAATRTMQVNTNQTYSQSQY